MKQEIILAYFVGCYFSTYAGLAIDDMGVEGTSIALEDMLDNLQIEEKEVVYVSESFQVRSSQIATVEFKQMIARIPSRSWPSQNTPAFMCRP